MAGKWICNAISAGQNFSIKSDEGAQPIRVTEEAEMVDSEDTGEKTAAKLKQRRIPGGSNNPSLGDEDAQKILASSSDLQQ